MDEISKNQKSRLESFETGRSKSKGSKKKVRRVSQRREMAIVTLGMVASITGLGGLLAASPPPFLVAQEEMAVQSSGEAQANTVDATQEDWSTPAPVQDDQVSARPVQEPRREQPAVMPPEEPSAPSPPSWSSSASQAPATKSRGS